MPLNIKEVEPGDLVRFDGHFKRTVNKRYRPSLTEGKEYAVLRVNPYGYVMVRNNRGVGVFYNSKSFTHLGKIPKDE